METYNWPYGNELGEREEATCDVLVLGGGLAGCYAAIAAARRGQSVILVEKGNTEHSGSAGTGFDHWESACTNPCSEVTPEEIAWAYVHEQDGYSNGIAHYIECREGYDRLIDMESFGGKVRDTEGEFEGAAFRDEKTKLMFAYDYKNKFTLRVWGSTFKPALVKELKRLGVRIYDRTEATALLTTIENGKKRGIGAMGMNVRTGKFMIFRSKTTVLTMSRSARVWLFNPDTVGLCEFRPMQSIGSGHAMGYRAGMEFTMMEKSVQAEFSAAGRSFPPYGAGNNHNTWYAATMVDARGVEIPYVDADEGMNWKELNMAISKAMQNYCGGVKCDALLKEGLDLLDTYKKEFVPKLYCTNPHDLMRTHEVLDILTVAELILQACLLRRENSETLCFARTDTDAVEEKGKGKHIVLRQENGRIISRESAT